MKELWRPITGYKGYYEASNLGRIRSLDREEPYNYNGVLLTRFRHGTIIALNKFNRIRLCKNSKYKDFPIDKLIASTWLPNPDNYDYIIHKDGNVLNNCISNLKWAPYKYRSDSKVKSNEIWRPIPEYEDLYEVSNTGKVRSISRSVNRNRVRNSKSFDDLPKYVSKELKPCWYTKKSNIAVYHLHRRYKPGARGQTDTYHRIENLLQEVFPELYEEEN